MLELSSLSSAACSMALEKMKTINMKWLCHAALTWSLCPSLSKSFENMAITHV